MKKIILITLIIIVIVLVSVVYVRYIRRPAITKEHLEQRFSQIRKAYQVKLDQGYDLTEVLNYGKQALEAYKREDYQIADKLLNQAFISLERAKIPPQPIKQCPLCSLPSDWSNCLDNKQTRTNYNCGPETNYQCQAFTEERSCGGLPTSNSWIMDKSTIEDETPKMDYGERQWWAWYGYAYTSNKTHELLLNANIYPLAVVLYGNSYTLDGILYTFDFTSINWDEKTKTLYGDMKRASDGKTGTWKLSFPENGYRVYEQKVEGETLRIEFRSYGVPLWATKNEEQMLQIGWADYVPVYAGGFSSHVSIKATLKRGEETLNFEGYGTSERAWIKPIHQRQGEAAMGFIFGQPDFYITFLHIRNPYDLNEDLIKSGRIGFSDKAYRFDDFTYTDDYNILENFKLQGTFEDGKVDLVGKRVGWLHERQRHPLIRWTGTIIRNGKTINVNSLGSGEFRRLKSR